MWDDVGWCGVACLEFSCIGATSATSVSFSFLFRLRQLVTHQRTCSAFPSPSHPSRGWWDWSTMGSHWCRKASRASGEGVGSEVWRGSCDPELRCSCVEMCRVLPVSAVGCWIQVDLRWSKDIQVQVAYFLGFYMILSPITICSTLHWRRWRTPTLMRSATIS